MKGWYGILALVGLGLGLGALYVIAHPDVSLRDTIDGMTEGASNMRLTSSVFEHNSSIPSLYTCDENRLLNPALQWEDVPDGTVSFALIMDDPDIPQVFKEQRGIDSFDHWTLFNIPADVRGVPEGGSVGVVGKNSAGNNAYTGPCPPPEYEPSEHRYIFRLYALDTMLSLGEGATKQEVLAAMEGHIVEQAELVGRYKRK